MEAIKERKTVKYVSPIKWPPEVEAELARVQLLERGSPEYNAWVDGLREEAFNEGLRRDITVDEVLYALERDRAGYDGLGELWRSTSSILTQA
jgi:hypothetical protein